MSKSDVSALYMIKTQEQTAGDTGFDLLVRLALLSS